MGIGAAGADEDGLDFFASAVQVFSECVFHAAGGVARQVKVVARRGLGDEGVDSGEGVGWGDEN